VLMLISLIETLVGTERASKRRNTVSNYLLSRPMTVLHPRRWWLQRLPAAPPCRQTSCRWAVQLDASVVKTEVDDTRLSSEHRERSPPSNSDPQSADLARYTGVTGS
jgi:hypothetical protein